MLNIDLSVSRFFDEMLLAEGQHRGHYDAYWQWLQQADQLTIARKREEAALLFHRVGITFNVYGDDDGAGVGVGVGVGVGTPERSLGISGFTVDLLAAGTHCRAA